MKPVPKNVSYVLPVDGVMFGLNEVVRMEANITKDSSLAFI